MSHLPTLDPSLSVRLPRVPRTGSLKPTEDKIDAVLCAYIAAHWWRWSMQRNRLYGNEENGYIVVPQRTVKKRCSGADFEFGAKDL
jgi:predicted RNase H-like nuclease